MLNQCLIAKINVFPFNKTFAIRITTCLYIYQNNLLKDKKHISQCKKNGYGNHIVSYITENYLIRWLGINALPL